jgi:hypothetical protein
MGNSSYTSNIVAKGSAITARGFSNVTATAGTFTTLAAGSGGFTTGGSYMTLGTKQYLMWGDLNAATSVAKTATAINASCQGSMYLSSGGTVWVMESDTEATSLAAVS